MLIVYEESGLKTVLDMSSCGLSLNRSVNVQRSNESTEYASIYDTCVYVQSSPRGEDRVKILTLSTEAFKSNSLGISANLRDKIDGDAETLFSKIVDSLISSDGVFDITQFNDDTTRQLHIVSEDGETIVSTQL